MPADALLRATLPENRGGTSGPTGTRDEDRRERREVAGKALSAAGYRGSWVHTMTKPDGMAIIVVAAQPVATIEVTCEKSE